MDKEDVFKSVISHFDVKKLTGGMASCICPVHQDKAPSLHISMGQKKVILDCKAGCDYRSILSAAGLRERDLYYNSYPTNKKMVSKTQYWLEKYNVARYDYCNIATGQYTHTKYRMIDQQGRKQFPQGVYRDGIWNVGLDGVDTALSVFCNGHFDKLKAAISSGKLVCYTEGEKDCLTMWRHGFISFTCGAVQTFKERILPHLKGANIIVFGDNDERGIADAKRVCDLINTVATARVIIPPNLPLKGDVSDFMANHTPDDLKGLIGANTAVTDKKTCGSSPSLVDKLVAIDAAHNYPTNDIGSSYLFSAIFCDTHRYNSTAKDWFYYDGKNWTLDREGLKARNSAKLLSKALTKYAVNHVPDSDEKLKENYLKYALTWTNYRVRNAIIQDSRDINFISNEMLDSDDYILNLPNCVLRFNREKVERLEHSAGLLLSKMANAEYQPGAKCERWERFLDEVMEGDTAKIHYLQKLFGMALTGDCSQEKMWFLHGSTTRNGKSTLVEIIANVLGDYARTIKPESLAIRNNPDSRQASPDIAKLQNIRLCICSEIPKRMPLDTGLLKTLTGRDTIVARHLHQEEFEFKPKFKLICNTNYLPTTSDTTVFKSDRLQVISFDRHFSEGEQDKHLKDKLSTKEAMSGILGWLISGWVDYCREGLEPPETIRKATTEYAAASDKLQNFINDCLTPSEGKNVTIKESYSRYEKWCQENGFHTENKRNFMEDCKSKGIYKERGMVDGVQARNIIIGYIFPENDFVKAEGNVPFT